VHRLLGTSEEMNCKADIRKRVFFFLGSFFMWRVERDILIFPFLGLN